MNSRYMLDTDMCIFIARNRPPTVRARFHEMESGDVVISAITHGELSYGAAKSDPSRGDRQKLDRVIMRIPVAPLDAKTSSIYGTLRADLERKGNIIGNHDLWIGAHALSLGLILVTNNEREFKRVPSLSIENWLREVL